MSFAAVVVPPLKSLLQAQEEKKRLILASLQCTVSAKDIVNKSRNWFKLQTFNLKVSSGKNPKSCTSKTSGSVPKHSSFSPHSKEVVMSESSKRLIKKSASFCTTLHPCHSQHSSTYLGNASHLVNQLCKNGTYEWKHLGGITFKLQ